MGCQPWSCRTHVLTSKDLATKNESLATTVFWLTFLALDKILIKKRSEMSNRSLLRNVVYSEAQASWVEEHSYNIITYSTFLYQSKSQRKLNECLQTSDATDAPSDPIWGLFPCKRIWKDCASSREDVVKVKQALMSSAFSHLYRCLHGWQRFQLQRTRARKWLTRWFDQRIHGPKNNPKAWRVDKKRQHTD